MGNFHEVSKGNSKRKIWKPVLVVIIWLNYYYCYTYALKNKVNKSRDENVKLWKCFIFIYIYIPDIKPDQN